MAPDAALQAFIDDVQVVLDKTDDQYEITKLVAERLTTLLASGYELPPAFTRPSKERHLNYPLYLAPDESWCVVSVVWNMGQRTPVHGHETWGVAGIYSGAEREFRYLKPAIAGEGGALEPAGEVQYERGQVTVCCTTDDDVHSVVAVGDVPTIGIHVYGANIGTLNRPAYDPATGDVRWFVSPWDHPATD